MREIKPQRGQQHFISYKTMEQTSYKAIHKRTNSDKQTASASERLTYKSIQWYYKCVFAWHVCTLMTRVVSNLQDNQTVDSDIFYAGGVAGGVFVSYNRGQEWHAYNAGLSNLAIADLAQTSDGILFATTGPMHDNPAGYNTISGMAGGGVFRRDVDNNGNINWTNIIAPTTDAADGDWRQTSTIVAHPTEVGKIYVGTNAGLWASANANTDSPTFFEPTTIFTGGNIDDVVISPDGKSVYVAVAAAVRKYTDNGGTDVAQASSVNLPSLNGSIWRSGTGYL